jgi:hypothetical protein
MESGSLHSFLVLITITLSTIIIPATSWLICPGLRSNQPMHDLPNTTFFIDSDIAVGQNADGRLQVFALGSNNHILTIL